KVGRRLHGGRRRYRRLPTNHTGRVAFAPWKAPLLKRSSTSRPPPRSGAKPPTPASPGSSKRNCSSRRSPSTACAASTDRPAVPTLDASLRLHDHVAVRPEPFGALAYHYDTRKLIFLRHPDVVRVVESLHEHATLADALRACGIAE